MPVCKATRSEEFVLELANLYNFEIVLEQLVFGDKVWLTYVFEIQPCKTS